MGLKWIIYILKYLLGKNTKESISYFEIHKKKIADKMDQQVTNVLQCSGENLCQHCVLYCYQL